MQVAIQTMDLPESQALLENLTPDVGGVSPAAPRQLVDPARTDE